MFGSGNYNQKPPKEIITWMANHMQHRCAVDSAIRWLIIEVNNTKPTV
jgi:hypothetical protein